MKEIEEMTADFSLSPDAQAVLLLCSAFGRNDRAAEPLTLAQYNMFAAALNKLQKRPADLLSLDENLIGSVCGQASPSSRVAMPDKERVLALLRRGMSLSTAIDKWSAYGVRVVSRADALYPRRMREHLKEKSPAVLYYSGNEQLFEGGGMAVVGSRDLDAEAAEAIRKVVRGCVENGLPIVSGGAQGADQTAMREAFSCGGKVVGALPCYLLKACLEPSNRDALANGDALLFSAHDPEQRPFNYGAVAMGRNKYIYAMADQCFVAQSGISSSKGKSGTFEGAMEELKRPQPHPVYVFLGTLDSRGCLELLKNGARKWNMAKTVVENINNKVQTELSDEDGFLPGLFVAEPVREYHAEPAAKDAPSRKTGTAESQTEDTLRPYDLFVAELRTFLSVRRKETEIKKRLAVSLDLLPVQVKAWLDKAEKGRIVRCAEYPVGKKGKPCKMVELVAHGEEA